MRVFVTGATGLIGRRLVAALHERGDEVRALSRSAAKARETLGGQVEIVEGDPAVYGDWSSAVNGSDAAVNLAGERVVGSKWTEEQKQKMRSSRIDSTDHLVRAIAEAEHRPQVLVSGSAIGYYGFHEDEWLNEQSLPGDDFLARLCVDWEAVARQAAKHGVPVVLLRTGVVLDPEGGALAQMLPAFRMFLGGPVGTGRQWLSWIHRDDLVGLILFALDRSEAQGPINGTAPEPQTNRAFSKTLASVLGRPCIFRVPALALRLRFGEGAELITRGQRVLPARAQELGYRFRFPELRPALEDLLR
jgi:uncharacterized protein (TIGR01777 family)